MPGRRGPQHPRLPEPVHQPALRDRPDRVGEPERARRPGPASANDPVVSRASSRIARPYIPIGMQPTADAITGARAPGSDSSAP